jgi:hypothetical protein
MMPDPIKKIREATLVYPHRLQKKAKPPGAQINIRKARLK